VYFDDEAQQYSNNFDPESSVTFPSIQLASAQTSRNASVSKKADAERMRLEKMKFYATYIRKVNEDNLFKKKEKRSKYPLI